MRNDFLAGARAPLLADLAAGRLLVGFDYDGVLAPLITAPDGRAMRPATGRLLWEVARRYPVAVVSGRAHRDLARLVPGRGIVRVGNHGFELGRAVPVPRRVLARVAEWEAEVARRLEGVPGWHVEHKRSTLSIHYGMGREWRRVEREVQAAGRALRGARLLPGKKVLNVIPASFPTKGDAVLGLLARYRLDVALFLGDDLTDEDVFRIGEPTVVGVRVGTGVTAARWRLRSQEDVDQVLERLRELRAPRRAPWKLRPLKRALG
jgi:trehalose 6-phosphate phosphatase